MNLEDSSPFGTGFGYAAMSANTARRLAFLPLLELSITWAQFEAEYHSQQYCRSKDKSRLSPLLRSDRDVVGAYKRSYAVISFITIFGPWYLELGRMNIVEERLLAKKRRR